MGALHAGHGTVIRAASAMGPVLVSVFVNPLQFGPDEDLARYPRRLESDLALAEQWGAAALWAPSAPWGKHLRKMCLGLLAYILKS